jgi:hypothetical protein
MKTRKLDADDYGMTEEQSDFLYFLVLKALSVMDSRDHHFALFVLTHEGRESDKDLVSTNLISSMQDKEFLHDAMRMWLHKETH